MIEYEKEIVEFVLAWEPFGGPSDEDTFPKFGLTSAVLIERFREIVARAGQQPIQADREDEQLLARARNIIPNSMAPNATVSQPQSPQPMASRALDITTGEWLLKHGVYVWTPRRPPLRRPI